MTPRTSPCDQKDARLRLVHAEKFLEVAELVGDEADAKSEYANVVASLLVLSGIASADAACCVAWGRRSRAQDHHDAEDLVSKIHPDGTKAALHLRRLLSLKDEAQYGVIHVSRADLRAALRHARQLLIFGKGTLRI